MYNSLTENVGLWRNFLMNYLRPMRRFNGAYCVIVNNP